MIIDNTLRSGEDMAMSKAVPYKLTYTFVGDNRRPVPVIERFVSFIDAVHKSRLVANTVPNLVEKPVIDIEGE